MPPETDLQITAKRLGLVTIESYCPRCFWYKLKQRFKMPFDMFGGAVWKNLEQAQIAVVNHLIESKKALPDEFAPFQNLVSVVDFPRDFRKFRCVHSSGVTLYGEPDCIFEVDDGSLAMIDMKTGHRKDGTDPLLPMYKCQAIGYAYVGEKGLRLGRFSKGGIIYWSCQHPQVVADPKAAYKGGQLSTGFIPQPVEVEIDYDELDAPIKEALSLWKSDFPPDRKQGCRDCKKVDAFLQLEANLQHCQDAIDRNFLDRCVRDSRDALRLHGRRFHERGIRLTALQDVIDMEEDLSLSETGMIANWD